MRRIIEGASASRGTARPNQSGLGRGWHRPAWILSLILLLTMAIATPLAVAQDEGEPVKASQLIRSVVLINTFSCDAPPVVGQKNPVPFQEQRCNAGIFKGSGSIIDEQGRILTNDHVIRPDRHGSSIDADSLGWYLIYYTLDARELPVPAYYAVPVMSNASLDLAVLEPAFTLDGQPIVPGSVQGLPILPIAGEPGTVDIEDTLRLLGYPREHPLVTASTVNVVGFEPDSNVPELGNVAWIRTDIASAGPGNSGGPAVNARGEIVAVVSAGTRNQLDCRDYDGDGEIDPVSECVTAAGGSEYTRPVPEAYELLLQEQGDTPEPPVEEPIDTPEPPEEPTDIPEPPAVDTPTPEEPVEEPTPTTTVVEEPTPDPNEPAEPNPNAGTAIVTGSLVSADTGDPIVRGQVIVLNPGFSVLDWKRGRVGDEAIFTWALSDGRGFFQIPEPVVRGERYSVWIQAAGYEELFKDDMLLATDGDPAIVDLGTIQMPVQT
jgi:hypothetical protein